MNYASYLTRKMLKLANSTCTFILAFNAVKTRIKVNKNSLIAFDLDVFLE